MHLSILRWKQPQISVLIKSENLTVTFVKRFISSVQHATATFNGKGELLGCPSNGGNPFSNYLRHLRLPHVPIDSSAFASLLEQCAQEKALLLGMLIHNHIVECGLLHITYVANFLLQMYRKCEAFSDLLDVFVSMRQRNGFSWNLVIGSFAWTKQSEEALHCFHRMQEEAVLPTSITCVSTVDACTNDIELDLVHRMHTRSMNIDLGEEAVIWQSVLINIYGKCKNFNFASRVFVKMQEKNVISWTTMINVCKQMDRGTDAHKYFQQMQQEGILPNKHTWVTIIASCAGDSDLILGRQIHASLHVSQFDTDSVMGSALIDMYDKCNSLVEAEMIFKTLLMPNIVAWTAMINSYCHHGYEELAFSLFDRMKHDGLVPNKATFIAILGACVSPEMLNTGKHLHESIHKQGFECDACVATGLINMYARCGSLEDAKALFKCLPKSDVVFWNSMLGAYGLFGRVDKAFETFDLMQNLRVTPTKSTYLNLLAVLMTDAARLHETRSVHNCIVEAGLESDTAIENALINIYGKSASLTDAQKVFSKIYNRDVSIWSSMISIHAGNGFGERALYLFSKMQDDKVSPDEITLTSALVACSQAGLLDEAYRLFTLMEEIHNCIPVLHHYVCMMDVLGRAGLLEDLAILMKHMPFQPGSVPITASMSFYWRYISIQMCLEIV